MNFWLKKRAIGRLYVSIGRNDWVYSRRKGPIGISLDHSDDWNVFFTLRIGTHFINVDLT